MDLIDSYDDEDWKRHFRMTSSTFHQLLDIIGPAIERKNVGGRNPISVKEIMLISIEYLANNITMRTIAVIYGRSPSCVWKAIECFTKALQRRILDIVQWPEDLKKVEQQFRSRAGMPGVVGAIDGCQIRIKAPAETQKDYLNRKFFHSINLLAVSLPDKSFSYVHIGYPGSVHDSRVYRNSSLGRLIRNNPSKLFPNNSYHLIGDSAFPCSNFMIPAIKSALVKNDSERKFNFKLSQTRVGSYDVSARSHSARHFRPGAEWPGSNR